MMTIIPGPLAIGPFWNPCQTPLQITTFVTPIYRSDLIAINFITGVVEEPYFMGVMGSVPAFTLWRGEAAVVPAMQGKHVPRCRPFI